MRCLPAFWKNTIDVDVDVNNINHLCRCRRGHYFCQQGPTTFDNRDCIAYLQVLHSVTFLSNQLILVINLVLANQLLPTHVLSLYFTIRKTTYVVLVSIVYTNVFQPQKITGILMFTIIIIKKHSQKGLNG